MKINLVVHPIAYGGGIEFHSTNKKQKAWVKLGSLNGHYYLQFHDASGRFSTFIHEISKDNFINENALFMPKYVFYLIKTANSYINKMVGAK